MKKTSTTEENLKYWQTHVESYQRSGLSQREYCRQQGISYWSFNSWKRRLETKNTDLQEIPKEIVHSLSPAEEQIELIVEDRIKISIPDGFSEKTLKNILQVLGAGK